MSQSPFLTEAAARGFIHQCTDEAALDQALNAGPVGGYNDAYYWRVNNSTGATATLVMSINCQRPAGL